MTITQYMWELKCLRDKTPDYKVRTSLDWVIADQIKQHFDTIIIMASYKNIFQELSIDHEYNEAGIWCSILFWPDKIEVNAYQNYFTGDEHSVHDIDPQSFPSFLFAKEFIITKDKLFLSAHVSKSYESEIGRRELRDRIMKWMGQFFQLKVIVNVE